MNTHVTLSSEQPNIAYANAWVHALIGDPDNAMINWRFIHDKDKGKPAIKRRGTLMQMWQKACEWNAKGYGIFATINEMDGTGYDANGQPIHGQSGDKLENVAALRGYVLDLDDLNAMQNLQRAKEHTPAPWFVVQTSPNKAHVYWPLQGDERPRDRDEWAQTQAKLAQYFGGDMALANATQPVRVPGFYHRKGAPHLVTCYGLPCYGLPVSRLLMREGLVHVNVIDAGEHERKPLGDPGLSAPSREWAIQALHMMPVDGLDHAAFISFLSAWKQAAWNHFEEAEARQMFLE